MAGSTHYETLGVDRNASKDDIRKAYYTLARKHHPDREGGDENKFKLINEANEILSDSKAREKYDQSLDAKHQSYTPKRNDWTQSKPSNKTTSDTDRSRANDEFTKFHEARMRDFQEKKIQQQKEKEKIKQEKLKTQNKEFSKLSKDAWNNGAREKFERIIAAHYISSHPIEREKYDKIQQEKLKLQENYEILGVDKNASTQDIHDAYYNKVRKFNGDRAKLERLRTARDILSSNHIEREKYDKIQKEELKLQKIAHQTKYEILGVDKNATTEDIKKAYEQQSSKLYQDDVTGGKMILELYTAYSILVDPKQREKYDNTLHNKEKISIIKNFLSDCEQKGLRFCYSIMAP